MLANARGVFFGLSPVHRREHLLRATVEGVSFALFVCVSEYKIDRKVFESRETRTKGESRESGAIVFSY